MEAKRSLGQNFFANENKGQRIVEFLQQSQPEVVVEVGPGQGFFSKKIITGGAKLVLIEKDDLLAFELSKTLPDAEMIHKDFLDWDFTELEKYRGKKISFFGSLPYNVSKPIIQRIISSEYFVNDCFFIVQKEVADKYIATVPDNNILSLKTQLFAKVSRIFDISPESFKPRPKVQSSYIKMIPKTEKYSVDTDKFIRFIEQCFRSPRKTLRNNLRIYENSTKIEDGLLNKRPQHLTLEEYITIFTLIL